MTNMMITFGVARKLHQQVAEKYMDSCVTASFQRSHQKMLVNQRHYQVVRVHNVCWEYSQLEHRWKVCSGVQVVTALMMERGDPILCEEYSYFYMLDSVITAAGYKVLPVAMDEHGMKPEHLNQVRLPILHAMQCQP